MSAEAQTGNDPTTTAFTVFYSWQSDLPNETNRSAIRNALRLASSAVEGEIGGIQIIVDEATRDMSGSPNIPQTILSKIQAADAFVGDITTINSTAPENLRRVPNPNVVFELGYAVAQLGWGRVVMVFNKALGMVEDVPFDFDRHRISSFQVDSGNPSDGNSIRQLKDMLKEALKAVIIQQPEKPSMAFPQSPEVVRRQRDIANIKWVMSAIHLPTLDRLRQSLPEYIDTEVFFFWEEFDGRITSALFHVYDELTRATLFSFHDAWEACLAHGTHYLIERTGKRSILTISHGEDVDSIYREIEHERDTLTATFSDLVQILRANYLEFDINDTSKVAWKQYCEDEKISR
jgi:hypothetical protein